MVRLWPWSMAALSALLCFPLLLGPGSCEGDPPLAPASESPILNLTLNERKKVLSWACRGNVTSQSCHVTTPGDPFLIAPVQVQDDDSYFCFLPNCVLHRGATLSVNVTSDGVTFQKVLVFKNPGKEASGAENFSCVIYDVCFMNCSWAPGRAAPADVQYQLYSWTSRHDNETECPQYLSDAAGRHVGCHFDQRGQLHVTDYFFFLTGTSHEDTVRFVDFPPFKADQHEKYNPPANVTVSHNGSHYVIRWDNPRIRSGHSSHMLSYELDIQRKGGSPRKAPDKYYSGLNRVPPRSMSCEPQNGNLLENRVLSDVTKVFHRGGDENTYVVPSSEARAENTLRMRVKHLRFDIWSAWSETLGFGTREDSSGNVPVATVLLAVGTAALPAIVLMVLCKRFSITQRLFPPIPQVKGELTSMFTPSLEIAHEGTNFPAGSQEPEDILTVHDTA